MSLSRYFIDRPIFAWVVGLLIMLAGVVSILRLPISQYPEIAPPSVSISASYPGADARTVEQSVTQIIEQNMTSLDRLLYMQADSDNSGSTRITLTFANGTDPDIAQVQVQNKLQQAMPLLPQVVQLQGVHVTKGLGNILCSVGLISDNGMSEGDLADYIAGHLVEALGRVQGVGGVRFFGAEYAMRIWLDADHLAAYRITPADVAAAVQAQNAQLSAGQLGASPALPGQGINVTIGTRGRLQTAEQFRNIVLRANSDGSMLHLSDVARVELGQSDYSFHVRYNGQPASGLGVTLASGANALSTVKAVYAEVDRLSATFPPGVKAIFPFDTTPFVRKSIEEVVKTLVEAILLVFGVMYLFLQNFRATIIPAIAVPVVLLGTFCVLSAFGYSINMLTMFAVVLAIGLLVDDAIVVVENVERLMSDEGLSPLEATRKSMDQITGALVGIAVVLSAVFVPMAFLGGSTGVIYRQFSVTIVSAMVLSVIVAIVITPALCATLIKPVAKGEHHGHGRFFTWFNSSFDSTSARYQGFVGRLLARPGRQMVVYLGLSALMGLMFLRLPTAFLPAEDQGWLMTMVQGPVNSTQERTGVVLKKVEKYFLEDRKDAIRSLFTISGFSYGGSGENSGMGFILLKDWKERKGRGLDAISVQQAANMSLFPTPEAMVFTIAPPPIITLGSSSGFDFHLRDEQGQGHEALVAARNQLLGMAAQDKLLANVRPTGSEDAPRYHLELDPQRLASVGVSEADANSALSIAWGGRYIDDFVDRGRVKHVLLQADAPFRMQPEDIGRWHVRNSGGQMVSLAAVSTGRWDFGPAQLGRFQGAPSVEIQGEAAAGVSSGEAMNEIERLVKKLPPGFSVGWTGESYQERAAGAQLPLLYTLSLVVIFLALAALYESWSMPTAIIMAVPLGVIGAVIATAARGFERDIYFQVAMLTTIGLACKNSILITEFAKKYVEDGMDVIPATLHAVRDRLRPILMTSLAFGLGVLPLAVANGAGAGAQRAIGTGVFGGMVAGTFLGIFFIPVFFVVVQRLFHGVHKREVK